jgi:hypothetical protein
LIAIEFSKPQNENKISKMQFFTVVSVVILMASTVSAFSVSPPCAVFPTCQNTSRLSSPLFMGRAAAVRAATKGKTDAKKAKTNALYGKKIIMAVKQGGPDPNANRALADLIKQAKANSVPVDVSYQ